MGLECKPPEWEETNGVAGEFRHWQTLTIGGWLHIEWDRPSDVVGDRPYTLRPCIDGTTRPTYYETFEQAVEAGNKLHRQLWEAQGQEVVCRCCPTRYAEMNCGGYWSEVSPTYCPHCGGKKEEGSSNG